MNGYQIERDEFIRIFEELDKILIDIYEFENEKIKIWKWEDEYFILEKDTGIIVNWYKHLGRCNTCNKKLTIENYETFGERILEELKQTQDSCYEDTDSWYEDTNKIELNNEWEIALNNRILDLYNKGKEVKQKLYDLEIENKVMERILGEDNASNIMWLL